MVRKVERIKESQFVKIQELQTAEDVADVLGENLHKINSEIDKGLERYYFPFKIPKKRPGEWRDIIAPLGPKMYKRWKKNNPERIEEAIAQIGCEDETDLLWLYQMQAQILYKILYRCRLSNRAHGFIQKRSTATGAGFHTNQEIVIEIDLEKFFPNIKAEQVVKAVAIDGIGEEAAKLIVKLCTFKGEVPQGAVTSPAISNLVARKLDYRLAGLAKRNNFNYSRYADNIFISGGEIAKERLGQIFAIVTDEGFILHPEKKAKLTRKGNRQMFCGWTLNKGVAYPKRQLKKFRAIMHNITKNGLQAETDKFNSLSGKSYTPERFKNYVRGMVSLINMAPNSKRYAEKFKEQFNEYFIQKVKVAINDDEE